MTALNRFAVLLGVAAAFSLAACGNKEVAPASSSPAGASKPAGEPVVYAANYPLKHFAERIGGSLIEVKFTAPADEDPAFWQPDDKTIEAFQNADLILMNGATYSKWAEKASLPAAKLADTSAGFKANYIEIKDAVTHSHGPGGDHSHGGIAFTTWLDFNQAIMQAAATRVAIGRVLPDAAAALDANLKTLTDELSALDERLKAVGARMKSTPVVASHPVYQYFARRYAINLKAVLWEPETVPDDKAIGKLKAILALHPAHWMIWEGDPVKESIEKLKALGIESLVFDPCGKAPESGDFMSVMKANVEALEKAFPQH